MSERAVDPVGVFASGGAAPEAGAPAAAAPRERRLRAEHLRDYGILVVFAALFAALSIGSSHFLQGSNLLNILYENAPLGITACAVTPVIIAGNFDLSLGSIYALSGVLSAEVAVHLGTGWGIVTPLVAGALLGLVNGLLITKLRVNSFLATLATSLAYGGAAVAISGGLLVQVSSSAYVVLGQDGIGPVQYSVLVFVGVAVVLQLVLATTVFGRHCYGVGGNVRAARQSGIRADGIVVVTFMIGGAGAGLAGLINTSTQGSGDATAGTTLALIAIAAVALGGTSIFGGAGAVWRTVIGVLLLALIVNGFDLLGVAAFYQDIVEGALILLAVAVSSLVRVAN